MHKPIQIKNLNLSFPHKTCFDNFSTQIGYGDRIAIIGRNGSGKSSLLKMLHKTMQPSSGIIQYDEDVISGYVPQLIENFNSFSGSQRFHKALTQAISRAPNLLLLDEPTNHLDKKNRKHLFKMLENYVGTLIIVSHDVELFRHCVDIFWHIGHEEIHIFSGNYDHYIQSIRQQRQSVTQELAQINRQKKETHHALMKEQHRSAKSRKKGEKSIEQRKWPTIVSRKKALYAEETTGRKKFAIESKKQDLLAQLENLKLPEEIIPTFSISTNEIREKLILSIKNGSVGYQDNHFILEKINLNLRGKNRVAILGDNASGKSTLIKALLNLENIKKSGDWQLPKRSDIGYLDQHYISLSLEKTVYETIHELMPNRHQNEIRSHLNDFLFRKNEEVNAHVKSLSGGEKVRLVLAQIAAMTPKLLILDEITNNLDLETREHVIEVLKNYPAAMIVISHDSNFLKAISVQDEYEIMNGVLCQQR